MSSIRALGYLMFDSIGNPLVPNVRVKRYPEDRETPKLLTTISLKGIWRRPPSDPTRAMKLALECLDSRDASLKKYPVFHGASLDQVVLIDVDSKESTFVREKSFSPARFYDRVRVSRDAELIRLVYSNPDLPDIFTDDRREVLEKGIQQIGELESQHAETYKGIETINRIFSERYPVSSKIRNFALKRFLAGELHDNIVDPLAWLRGSSRISAAKKDKELRNAIEEVAETVPRKLLEKELTGREEIDSVQRNARNLVVAWRKGKFERVTALAEEAIVRRDANLAILQGSIVNTGWEGLRINKGDKVRVIPERIQNDSLFPSGFPYQPNELLRVDDMEYDSAKITVSSLSGPLREGEIDISTVKAVKRSDKYHGWYNECGYGE